MRQLRGRTNCSHCGRRSREPKHFETVDAEWRLKSLRRVAPMPDEDRLAYQSANTMNDQAIALHVLRLSTLPPSPCSRRRSKIRRRLLTDDHPETADSYNTWRANRVMIRASTAWPSRCSEKRLEILRRLLIDDSHRHLAQGYDWPRNNLKAQGKYAQAQPLFEKALEIDRRLLGDDTQTPP